MHVAVQAPAAVLPALQELIATGTYRPWQQSTLPAPLQAALQGGLCIEWGTLQLLHDGARQIRLLLAVQAAAARVLGPSRAGPGCS